jgi:hypothetical protein
MAEFVSLNDIRRRRPIFNIVDWLDFLDCNSCVSIGAKPWYGSWVSVFFACCCVAYKLMLWPKLAQRHTHFLMAFWSNHYDLHSKFSCIVCFFWTGTVSSIGVNLYWPNGLGPPPNFISVGYGLAEPPFLAWKPKFVQLFSLSYHRRKLT